jgi:hypothetical protein
VNALAKPEVGKYLDEYFVASYQKVATFTVTGEEKQGGNVASYFTTPDGRVLHVVAGPVNAAALLREARWVVETWKLAQLEGADAPRKLWAFMRKAHGNRLRREHHVDAARFHPPTDLSTPSGIMHFAKWMGRTARMDNQARVHLLLTLLPAPRVEQIYGIVFEKILNERLSTLPVVKG